MDQQQDRARIARELREDREWEQREREQAAFKHRAAVEEAHKILGSTVKPRAVGMAMRFVDRQRDVWESGRYGVKTGEQKDSAMRRAAVFRRLKALITKDVTDDFRFTFPLDGVDIDGWIRQAEKEAATPIPSVKQFDAVKKCAAEEAWSLMLSVGLEPKGRKYHRLAACLWGDKDADLRRHCAAVQKARKAHKKAA